MTPRRQCKTSSSKKIYLYRDFAAGVYLSEPQDPIPAPLTYCIRVYTGKGGDWGRGERESSTREKVRGAIVHKAGSKITA
jgi:hypothetical protein